MRVSAGTASRILREVVAVSNASIIVEKTGDLLRLRQHRQNHLFALLIYLESGGTVN
jgi:hypothetical protein